MGAHRSSRLRRAGQTTIVTAAVAALASIGSIGGCTGRPMFSILTWTADAKQCHRGGGGTGGSIGPKTAESSGPTPARLA